MRGLVSGGNPLVLSLLFPLPARKADSQIWTGLVLRTPGGNIPFPIRYYGNWIPISVPALWARGAARREGRAWQTEDRLREPGQPIGREWTGRFRQHGPRGLGGRRGPWLPPAEQGLKDRRTCTAGLHCWVVCGVVWALFLTPSFARDLHFLDASRSRVAQASQG